MGLLDRLSEGMRNVLDRNAPERATGVPLAQQLNLRALTDEHLRAELERRRRARGRAAHGRPAADDELDAMSAARRARARDRSLAKCYALLELPQSASRADIQRAYRTLLRQYHPDRYLGDAEAHASAVALVTSLTDAYLTLLAHHERR